MEMNLEAKEEVVSIASDTIVARRMRRPCSNPDYSNVMIVVSQGGFVAQPLKGR
jgi:hypothetical protein